METSNPVSAEAGSRAGAYSLRGQRLLYGTGLNLHCGATRFLRRERCVQRSLPCVDSSGKGALTPSKNEGKRASGNTVCKRGLEPEESCYGNHLGCRFGQIWDCGTDSVAIGYRHRQRAGPGMKGKPPLRRREVRPCGKQTRPKP